jgi:GH18 family chitinase
MNYSTIKLVLFSLLFSSRILAQNPCKEVVGYYPNWQWYDRNKLVNPQSIDYSKYSILNYAFFKPQADGTITILDPWADKNLLLGPINWAVAPAGYDTAYDFGNPAYHIPGHQFSAICHQHGVKFLPSIGGWTLSDNFPNIAADPQKRAQFAQSCVQLIQTFGFDGIDLDWEYPGYADHNGTPQDAANFTLLLQAIRSAIDNYGQSINKPMLLTIAVGAAADRMDDVQWNAIEPLVDIINVMSYDFFGTWDAVSNHNSPLYAPSAGDPEFNLHSSIDRLVNTYGVAPNKITAGIAFYGRSSKTIGAAGLHVPINGQADMITFQVDEGTPLYYNVLNQSSLFTAHWDDNAKVPYMTGNGSLNTFVSYENERSVGLKAEYIVDQALRGAIIWEITGDYVETAPGSGVISGTPLADTLNAVFCNYQGAGNTNSIPADAAHFDPIRIYPVPASNELFVITDLTSAEVLTVLNVQGAVIEQFESSMGIVNIPLANYTNGTYFVQIETSHGILRSKFVVLH